MIFIHQTNIYFSSINLLYDNFFFGAKNISIEESQFI